MKLKPDFTCMELAGKYIGIYTGSDNSILQGTIEMNEVSAFIWKLLEKDTTEEEIIKSVLEEYDGDEVKVKNDVKEIIKVLKDNGVIEE